MANYSEGTNADITIEVEQFVMNMAADEALDLMIGEITSQDLREIMDHTLQMAKIASNTTWLNSLTRLLELKMRVAMQEKQLELRTMEVLEEDPLVVMLRKEIEKQQATLPSYSKSIQAEMKQYKKPKKDG